MFMYMLYRHALVITPHANYIQSFAVLVPFHTDYYFGGSHYNKNNNQWHSQNKAHDDGGAFCCVIAGLGVHYVV